MVNINEELRIAREALAAIDNSAIRNAARRAQQESEHGPLSDTRYNAARALFMLIVVLEANPGIQESIGKAKVAVEAWIKELERARL